ncbi:alpha/beta fold hydrolase [Jeotgalibacillus salarius]|uniref:Alpha/beta hydrolase n=1 Tax=Jeotgalibacillus salarius TaxID=546023 RepID=A0A4Y8LJT4_9BACL|nr:alpha/beta hydrolase [Jeotgalibacillus salarius]TFE02845.1 alpha/beta hydrolase [Jeotgalibacillus salarius]
MKESFYTRTTDGKELYTVFWTSEQNFIKGAIQLCHGMAEHIGRYEDIASVLNQNGYHVIGHDCRGHGETAALTGEFGDYGTHTDFTRLADDVIEVRDQCLSNELPVYLFGHSMGSFIARRVIQLYSDAYEGVVLSGTNGPLGLLGVPATILASVLSAYQPKGKAELLNKLSFGSYNNSFPDSNTPFDWLSSNEAAVKQYIDDPKCGFVSTNRFYKVLFKGIDMIYNKKEINQIRKELPILFLSGKNDPVGDFGKGVFKSAQLYTNAGIQSVDVYLYENGRHEMLNEINANSVIDDLLYWLNVKKQAGVK